MSTLIQRAERKGEAGAKEIQVKQKRIVVEESFCSEVSLCRGAGLLETRDGCNWG